MPFRVARAILYLLGFAFLFGGFYFLLYSQEMFLNLRGFGVDTSNELVFWKTLTFAYMITISSLSFLIAYNIKAYWRAIPVLILAKLSSSLTGFAFYITSGVDLGAVIFAVDFPLALLLIAIYFWILRVRG